jgi:hypothetical protein
MLGWSGRHEPECRAQHHWRGSGPVEATVLGNILVQAIASGYVSDIAAGRRAVSASEEQEIFEPGDQVDWSNLKGVPEGFADGEDAAGSSDPNAGLSGYEIVEASSNFNNGSIKFVTAWCPSGKKVIGGGGAYSLSETGFGTSSEDEIAMQWSRPLEALPGSDNEGDFGWEVQADDMGTAALSSFSWRLIAYAVCADVA